MVEKILGDSEIKKQIELSIKEDTTEGQQKKNNIIENFIKKNIKKYISKVENEHWSVYEYDTYYKWYIKTPRKVNIQECYISIFKEKEIQSIHIDGVKRTANIITLKDDFKYASRVEISVKK